MSDDTFPPRDEGQPPAVSVQERVPARDAQSADTNQSQPRWEQFDLPPDWTALVFEPQQFRSLAHGVSLSPLVTDYQISGQRHYVVKRRRVERAYQRVREDDEAHQQVTAFEDLLTRYAGRLCIDCRDTQPTTGDVASLVDLLPAGAGDTEGQDRDDDGAAHEKEDDGEEVETDE